MKNYVEGKKAILVVNVATNWGLTKLNYNQLVQTLQPLRESGLEIFGVPCNQFGGQEPGTPAEIRATADKFGV